MKSLRKTSQLLVVAAALAAGMATSAYAGDNSMSIWTGESYRAFNGGHNFPNGSPQLNLAQSTFQATNPHGLSNAQYAALSSEDPMWQPAKPVNPALQREATAEARAWRAENPHGLSENDYVALSANSPVWQQPTASRSMNVAQLRDHLARLFTRSSGSVD